MVSGHEGEHSQRSCRWGQGMESAVKENTLKLFCESKINRLINVLSAKDGLWARSTATRFCGGGIGRRKEHCQKHTDKYGGKCLAVRFPVLEQTSAHVRCKSLPVGNYGNELVEC